MARFSDKLLQKIAAPDDMSLGEFQNLLQEGYNSVTWQESYDPCDKCSGLNGIVYGLQEFTEDLIHDAPFFERSHVGCKCNALVQAGNGEQDEFGLDIPSQLEPVIVQPT